MSQVWKCDWCEKTTPNKQMASWIVLEYERAGPMGHPEFCTWKCVSEFAAQKAKNQR